jgi:O-antigen/teichoic acid export membrane protein
MASGPIDMTSEIMATVPPNLRARIVSGMRWTLWLSILAAPFSYGTTVLLARAGPQVLGTYGLLIVYIGLMTSWFYLGGDAVTIKFVPELTTGQRAPFLTSYLLILLASLIPWLAVARLWPHSLHYLFGDQDSSFSFVVLCLSPIYLCFALVVAALKAELEMRWAQVMTRTSTIGTFLIYLGLFMGFRRLLVAHSAGVIWGVYLTLTALAFIVGFQRLRRLWQWKFQWRPLCIALPQDFWRFTLATQAVSGLGFLLQRLDLILVLNFGGLAVLGKYVAIISLAGLIQVGVGFFLDTLLPSLTNLLASRNYTAASQVYSMNLRTLFLVTMVGASGLIFMVGPIIMLLGSKYTTLSSLFVVGVLLYGLAAPGAIGGTLLTSLGKQHRSALVGLIQLALFVSLFYALWPRYQLLGAILAMGLSMAISSFFLIQAARYRNEVKFSFARDYTVFAIVLIAAAFLDLRLAKLGPSLPLLVWPAVVLLFCGLARYSVRECKTLVSCFLPTRCSF